MKAVVFSLGCKVNQCEGQSMIAALQQNGVAATDKLEQADVYVLNTCSVTAEADRKSRQAVARALKLSPQARIYVCGCSSQNAPQAFAEKAGVCYVSGTAQKQDIVAHILRGADTCGAAVTDVRPLPQVFENAPLPQHTKTRSYIKIQDGCNNFCSYCIIPYLRGRSRSRSLSDIADEARAAARTTREIVLTGINASAYGSDIGLSAVDLVRALGDIPVRKRFGSLECTAVTDELLQAMAQSGFCDHFHLSLQSGSESVLRRMNRHYTPDFFLSRVQAIRKVFPHAGITTDVITGFCGETEEEFSQTEAFVQAARFSELHVFPYSERAGTKAAGMPQVDKHIRCERANRLIALGERLRDRFIQSQFGRVHEVYAETEEDGLTAGYTANYIKVYSSVPVGQLGKVTFEKPYKDGVKGVKYEE